MTTFAGVLGWLFATPDEKRAASRATNRSQQRLEAHPNSPSARFPPTGHPDDQHDGMDGYELWCRRQRKSKRGAK